MTDAQRIIGSNLMVLACVVGVACLFALIGEYRMRQFVDYPWPEEKQQVLDSIQAVDDRIHNLEILLEEHKTNENCN